MPDRVAQPIEQLIREALIESPVARRMGIELAALKPDKVVLRLPFSPDNITVGTIVHGGVIATLIDTAAIAVSVAGLVEPPKGTATSTLTVTYLAPADNTALTAEALILRRGKRQTVEEVVVRDEAGTLVAKGLITNRVF